jgi:DHA1 family tetracycline resistance protein-like MFS transporter
VDQPQTSRYALIFIFVTIFIDTVGLGIIIPVTPKIIEQLTHEGLSEAARYGGWLMFVFSAMQFLCAPLIGNLSDRYGRRPVLILSLLAIGVDYAITGLAPTIAWLFVGRFLSGIAGASYSTANAYIADVTPPEKRAQNFGLVGAAFGLGFIAGPALGGIVGEYGARLPFFVSAGLAFLNALYGFLVLRESLPKTQRRKFELWRANPVGALEALSRYPAIFGLCGVTVLMRLAHDANPSIYSYYTILKFHWTPAQLGYSLMALGAMTTLVFGLLTRLIIPRIGEVRAVYLGLACGALGFFGYALATETWMFYAWMTVWSFMGLAGPALSAIMSRHVPATEQGELQGALASMGSLTSIIAPPLLTNIFGYFTRAAAPLYFPGAAFCAAGLCLLAAALLFARARPQPIFSPAE